MKALGCLVRSLNDQLIYLIASTGIRLILTEFCIFCRQKEPKETEYYNS